MSINIRIKGNTESPEYKDAVVLKSIFERELANISTTGEVLIINNATLFGQDTKDIDLIVMGKFEKYSCKINSNAIDSSKNKLGTELRNVFINSFCFVIETKKHRASDIELHGLNLLVKYNDKLHDVTTQSENQKYALKSFFEDRLGFAPYICNFIWFRNINSETIKSILDNNEKLYTKHNYLPNEFSLKWLFQLACVQQTPFCALDRNTGKHKGYSSFSCLKKSDTLDFSQIDSVFNLFDKVKKGTGDLTRKKIEQITSKLLDNQQYAQAIGEKFVVISGRAGTGKTIKLLRIACDLATQRSARSLILTYNHALVSDIKRTLSLAEIPDHFDSYTVNISTLHKYFYELLIGFGIAKNSMAPELDPKFIPDYFDKYDQYLEELYAYINAGLIQEREIQDLMRNRHDQVAWDYILIDEAQDWREIEKEIIFKLFGKERVIIADGIDQMIRTQKGCNWMKNLRNETDYRKTYEKRGLRQEVNLVSFVNNFAKELGVPWELEPKPELLGGKIIISAKAYSTDLHNEELKKCKQKGNTEYEMMFLVPPKLVQVRKYTNKWGNEEELRSFKLKEDYASMGINIWDSTSKDLRNQYPVDLNQHRLLQYESCRGLEGWTVVCLEFDEFIKYKMDTFKDYDSDKLESFQEKKNKFVNLWALIPLTRAIDTLIITLNSKNSEISKTLKNIAMNNPSFVSWIE